MLEHPFTDSEARGSEWVEAKICHGVFMGDGVTLTKRVSAQTVREQERNTGSLH